MTSPITSTPEQLKLDDTPLKFGKYRGQSPNEILENYGRDGASYIVWMYKTVENFDTCSPTLARMAQKELDHYNSLPKDNFNIRKHFRLPEERGFAPDDDISF